MHMLALYSHAQVTYPYDSSSLRLLITFFIDQEIGGYDREIILKAVQPINYP